jgi:hypothetical protein
VAALWLASEPEESTRSRVTVTLSVVAMGASGMRESMIISRIGQAHTSGGPRLPKTKYAANASRREVGEQQRQIGLGSGE